VWIARESSTVARRKEQQNAHWCPYVGLEMEHRGSNGRDRPTRRFGCVLSAQHGTPNTTAESQASFSIGKLFTFLFLTLGPFKIFGPFAAMTQGCDRAFKSQLAFKGIVIAALGMLVAATVGANTLYKWDISVGALQLGASIVLFRISSRWSERKVTIRISTATPYGVTIVGKASGENASLDDEAAETSDAAGSGFFGSYCSSTCRSAIRKA
jgi:hypothetical protein